VPLRQREEVQEMLRRILTRRRLLCLLAALASGLLLACAFPLPNAARACEGASAAWMALVPLFVLCRRVRPRAAFAWGWFSGFVFWSIALVWLLQLRHTWGYLPVVVLAWVALAAYCALYTGAFAALMAALFAPPASRSAPVTDPGDDGCEGRAEERATGLPAGRSAVAAQATAVENILFMLAAPCVWVAFEYLRAVLLTGFAWNQLGVSQYENLAVLQLAAFGGVYAVSACLVFLNAALTGTALALAGRVARRGPRRRLHPELMLGLAACAGCWMFGVRTVRHIEARDGAVPLRVACVQPNIPQRAKWDPELADKTYRTLAAQSRLALLGAVDLLVWPETAVPDLYRFDPTAQAIAHELVTNGVPLLLGTMDMADTAAPAPLYNSAFLIDTNAALAAVYRKQHLVPFGEYLPFEAHVAAIKRLAPLGFSCVPGDDPGVAPLPMAVLICFEDTLADLARAAVRAGARVLVNLTNDAWFDGSSAARQHLAHAVFRAVEQRVPLVRCTNTGLTGFVAPSGRFNVALWDTAQAAPWTGFTLGEARVPATAGSRYTDWGDWAVAFPALLVTLGLFVLVAVRKRRDDARSRTGGGRRAGDVADVKQSR